MVVAVLEARCGLQLGGRDIYLNVAGGLRVTEPAADLAVAMALVSAIDNTPFRADTVVFGELALSGEIRPVSQAELRLKEAAKLGFEKAVAPPRRGKKTGTVDGIDVQTLPHVRDLLRNQAGRLKNKALPQPPLAANE